MIIRDALLADHRDVLSLNEESLCFPSPLTPGRLQFPHRSAAHFCVLDDSGAIAAFVLALSEGTPYDSPNYRWFAARYQRFLYTDRVVVAAAYQGAGLGNRPYSAIVDNGQRMGAAMLACEFDVDPPNEQSARFHARFGFLEVGSQAAAGGKKRVSLQRLALPSRAGS